MSTLSKTKRLEIANICYANVSGMFAAFCNPKNVGPNFRWENFPSMMEREADLWMMLADVKCSDKELMNATAKQFANEIATTLIRHADFV